MSANPQLMVYPLNKAMEGPMSAAEALARASGHNYVKPEEKARVLAEIEAGGKGPWHFSYGFTSVTIELAPAEEDLSERLRTIPA